MKDNKIFWIIGIIALVIFLYSKAEEPEPIGINVHYYKDGQEVFPNEQVLSIITPPGGAYDSIAFEITGRNTGQIRLTNMQIVDALPLVFKNNLPTTSQTLEIGQTKSLWISNIISVSQFESYTQPVTFWVKVSGFSQDTKETIYKEFSLPLSFAPERPIKMIYKQIRTTGAYGTPTIYYNFDFSQGCDGNFIEYKKDDIHYYDYSSCEYLGSSMEMLIPDIYSIPEAYHEEHWALYKGVDYPNSIILLSPAGSPGEGCLKATYKSTYLQTDFTGANKIYC